MEKSEVDAAEDNYGFENKSESSKKGETKKRKGTKSQEPTFVSTNTSADGIPKPKEFLSLLERKVEVAIAAVVVPFLVLDYAFSGFSSGETLFVSDLWDMIATTLWLRSTHEEGFGWGPGFFSFDFISLRSYFLKSKKSEKAKDARIELEMKLIFLVYSFLSNYFFYCIGGNLTSALVMGDAKLLFDFWLDWRFMFQFLFLGFIPAYFSPNDFLNRMINNNANITHRLIGDATWAVSMLSSIKQMLVLLYVQSRLKNSGLMLFPLGFVLTILNCYTAAVVKEAEINYGKNQGVFNWPMFRRSVLEILKSVSFRATLFCSMMINLKFYLASSGTFHYFHVLLDVLALAGIFYRYSNDVVWSYSRHYLERFLDIKGLNFSEAGAASKLKAE